MDFQKQYKNTSFQIVKLKFRKKISKMPVTKSDLRG